MHRSGGNTASGGTGGVSASGSGGNDSQRDDAGLAPDAGDSQLDAAPPGPNTPPTPEVWNCAARVEGCPIGPPTSGAPCHEDKKTCSYGACCFQLATCKDGAWSMGPLECRP